MENFVIFLIANFFRTIVNQRFLGVFLDRDKSRQVLHFLTVLACFFITGTAYWLFHKKEVNIAANLAGLLFMAVIFHGNIRKKLLSVCSIYFINMICDVIVMIPFSGYGVEPVINELHASITVLLIAVCEIVTEKYIYVKKSAGLILPHWGFLLAIPICSMVMIHYLVVTSLIHRDIIVVEGIGLLVINLITFYFYGRLEEIYQENMEREMAVRTAKIYSNQLDIIMNSQEQLRALQHDMKYHLRELQSMAKSGHIPDMVSYLLDNAITAAQDSGEKYLNFEMVVEKSLLFLTVENSYHGQLKEKKGSFLTTKQDRTTHGYGLKNVERIVKKYNGTMHIEYDEKRFCVDMMLYLSNNVD